MALLPYVDNAIIDERKITHYLLSSAHSAGRGKAAFFHRFGFRPAAWQQLRDALLEHARSAVILDIVKTQFGQKYILEGSMMTPSGRRPRLRAIWFVSYGETTPRFVTAYAARGAQR